MIIYNDFDTWIAKSRFPADKNPCLQLPDAYKWNLRASIGWITVYDKANKPVFSLLFTFSNSCIVCIYEDCHYLASFMERK